MRKTPSQRVIVSSQPFGESTVLEIPPANPPRAPSSGKGPSIERVATPGMLAGTKSVQTEAKNLLEQAAALANNSLDSLREIKEMDEKKRDKLLKEIMLLKQELREKNLRIERLESAYTGGQDNFQRILDDKNALIQDLTAEVFALRDLAENKPKKGELQRLRAELLRAKKAYRDSVNLNAKAYKGRVHSLQTQLEMLKRNYMGVSIHTSILKREIAAQMNQLKLKLKRKFLRLSSLIATLKAENANLRKDQIYIKAYEGPLKQFRKRFEGTREDMPESSAEAERAKPKSGKLSELEKKLGQKKFQNEQRAQELDKWKDNFDELIKPKEEVQWDDTKDITVTKIKEERKTMNDKIALLNQTIEELSKDLV